MSDEIWKEIAGYPLYEVSNKGRVRSFSSTHGARKETFRVLKPREDNDGYLRLRIGGRKGKGKRFKISTLVAIAFHGARPHGMIVRHLDGSRNNNFAENLKWGTPKENTQDAVKHGTISHGESHYYSKLTSDQVVEIFLSTDSRLEMQKRFGVSGGAIEGVRGGKTWKHVTKDLTKPKRMMGPKKKTLV